jgi:hypothetical protein
MKEPLMSIEQEEREATIWNEVRAWSARSRLALASRILQSLEQEQAAAASASPIELIGIWKIDRPPTDEEIDRILDEERQSKHG